MAWVLASAETQSTTEVAVMIGLANHADAYGYHAFPSVPTLARYVKASERTVQRTLTTLEERGLIEQGDDAILSSTRIPKNHWPVVWNLRMSSSGMLLEHPDLVGSGVTSRGDRLTPLDSRGDIHDNLGVTPTSPKPYVREPSLSYESAFAESEQPNHVVPLKRQPRRKSGQRRMEVPENSPVDSGGRTIGIPNATDRSRRVATERAAIARPNSGGGLARTFGILASQSGQSGPQQVNGAALARSLTAWMGDAQNPDTPEAIRVMMERFFASPRPRSDRPLWRQFLAEAPQLRSAVAKDAPIDYRAAEARDLEQARRDAARGDVRAQKLIDGEDKPWRTWQQSEASKAAQEQALARRRA